MSRLVDSGKERYDERLAEIVRRLRRLADEVEREGTPRKGHVGWRKGEDDYVYAAQRVWHEVAWAVANLNLDLLVDAADDYHQLLAFESTDR